MTMFDADTQDYLNSLGNRPPAQMPATLGDVWNANWAEAGQHTIGYLDRAKGEAFDQLSGAYRSATGRAASDDARAAGIPNYDLATRDDQAGVIRMLSAGLPDDAQRQLAPHLDLDQGARRIAAKTEHDAQEIGARTYGVSGVATAFMAGLARTMVDPSNLAATTAIAIAAPEAIGFAGFAAREFAVNAGATAIQHPFVSQEREQVGLQPTPFFSDVLSAGAGGVALGSVLRAGGWALRRAYGARQDVPGEVSQARAPGDTGAPVEPVPASLPEGFGGADVSSAALPRDFAGKVPIEAHAALGQIEPEDFDALARHVQLKDELAAQAPAADPAGRLAHEAAIGDVSAAIDAGKAADSLPPIVDLTPKQRIAAPRDLTLMQYLAADRGLAPNPELQAIFDGNPFVPGFGRLIRKGGRNLDEALTAAKDGGYIFDPAEHEAGPLTKDVNDLLDALARNHAGERVYPFGTEAEREARANLKAYVQARVNIEKRVGRAFRREGIDPQAVDRGLMDATIRKLHHGDESDPLVAYERAIMEAHDNYEARHAERTAETAPIAGWDVPFDAEGAPQRGGEIARVGRPEADQIGGSLGADRGGDRAAAEAGLAGADFSSAGQHLVEPSRPLSDYPLTEAGAEGKPQYVIAGAEKAGQGDLAQRGADRGLTPKTAQRDTDALPLFNDSSKQSELFATDASQNVPRGIAEVGPAASASVVRDAAAQKRADAERVIAELGDMDLHTTNDAGEPVTVKASELLRDADEDAAAAREFEACINGSGLTGEAAE